MQIPPPCEIVTLLTDFGTRDPYVGLVKGMIKRRFPDADVVDLCHEVPPQDVAVGGFFWRAARGRFPAGTVHVGVVDPGVGSERAVLVAAFAEALWIAPDNGLLGAVLPDDLLEACEVRRADLERLRLRPESRTFHGRDVFGPLAAMLAGRRVSFRAVGPRVREIRRIEALEAGTSRVILVDRFGNLVTNVDAATVERERVTAVEVAGVRAPLRATYAEADPGELLALVNSYDLLEVAECQGDAARRLGVGRDAPVRLVFEQER